MTKTTYDNRKGKDDPGRKHKIDDTELVRKAIMGLAKQGKTISEIADIIGVSTTHLKNTYKHELKCGKELADALVVENIYQQAMKDSPAAMPAAMFIAKSRMGWREKEEAKDNRPSIVFDFGSLSFEERAALRETLLQKVSPPPLTIEGEVEEYE
jgi:hypothetical protein